MFASIPTSYLGINFRSRLEARWAAMFDLLEWQWHYEPLDLNGWIPDFVLTKTDLRPQTLDENGEPVWKPTSKPVLVECKPLTGKLPRAVTAKIEKALGVPLSPTASGQWTVHDGVHDSFDWENFFATKPYEALVVGAIIPCDVRDDWYGGRGFGMGWLFQRTAGWWPEEPLPQAELIELWKEAGNLMQWRAAS